MGNLQGLAGQAKGSTRCRNMHCLMHFNVKAVPEIRNCSQSTGTDKAVAEMLIALAELVGSRCYPGQLRYWPAPINPCITHWMS